MFNVIDNKFNLIGKKILVTGASSGIGRETAILLSKLGAKVIISAKNEDKLKLVMQDLNGTDHFYSLFDMNNIDLIVEWFKSIVAEHGPLDGIAHCSGFPGTKPLQAVNTDFIDQVMRVNLYSSIMIAKAFRIKNNHNLKSSLVFISSSAALKSAPGNSVYAASKGAIIALTKSLGIELLRDGIRVNCVAPAMVDTPMAETFKKTVTEDSFNKVIDLHPLGLGKPEDVAWPIAYLLSDISKWMTGSTFCIDGGFLA